MTRNLLLITNLRCFCITQDRFFFNIHGWAFIRGSIFGEICFKKSAFLVSKLGSRPLLEHGPLIEISWYVDFEIQHLEVHVNYALF